MCLKIPAEKQTSMSMTVPGTKEGAVDMKSPDHEKKASAVFDTQLSTEGNDSRDIQNEDGIPETGLSFDQDPSFQCILPPASL